MRRMTVAIFTASALFVSACGSSGGTFKNDPRPPVPVNLTVYIDNARVSVSPASAGAGPVVFLVTNQATRTENLMIQSGGGGTLASTGPINPQATAQVTVDLHSPGTYTVATGGSGSDAFLNSPSGIAPAQIRIGRPRASASDQLLEP